MSYIEGLNHESLDLSEDEFNRYMSGELKSHLASVEGDRLCEGLRVAEANAARLDETVKRLDVLVRDMSVVQEEMLTFHQDALRRVKEMREQCPAIPRQNRPRTKNLFDSGLDEDVQHTLPSPLTPVRPSDN